MIDSETLIHELAEVFNSRAKAHALFVRSRLPEARLTPWGDLPPLDYWRAVVGELESGLVEAGVGKLAQAARDLYPDNAVFRDAAAKPTTAAPEPGRTERSASPRRGRRVALAVALVVAALAALIIGHLWFDGPTKIMPRLDEELARLELEINPGFSNLYLPGTVLRTGSPRPEIVLRAEQCFPGMIPQASDFVLPELLTFDDGGRRVRIEILNPRLLSFPKAELSENFSEACLDALDRLLQPDDTLPPDLATIIEALVADDVRFEDEAKLKSVEASGGVVVGYRARGMDAVVEEPLSRSVALVLADTEQEILFDGEVTVGIDFHQVAGSEILTVTTHAVGHETARHPFQTGGGRIRLATRDTQYLITISKIDWQSKRAHLSVVPERMP